MKKYDFIAGIPCSGLKDLIKDIERYVPCTREDEALAMAVGAYLAGKRPLVYLQNSGLGHIVDAATSLLEPYGIDIDLVVSLRTRPRHHAFMGKITKKLLKVLNYKKYKIVEQCEE